MISADDILHLAQRYASAHRPALNLTTVSTRVFGDSKKLAAIRDDGADLTLSRAKAALEWFSAHWPETCVWPSKIDRPSKPKGRAA